MSCSVRSPFCAPMCWTTDMEFMGARRRASLRGSPLARKAARVEENASPAPVRSFGGAMSGYWGTKWVVPSLRAYAPLGPSVMTAIVGPFVCISWRRALMFVSCVLRMRCASCLLQMKRWVWA